MINWRAVCGESRKHGSGRGIRKSAAMQWLAVCLLYQIARTICRIVFDMRRQDMSVPQITFVDPDIIEEKNIGRQMFTYADVGKHKAELLAKRFSYALGITVNYRNQVFNADWYKTKSFSHEYFGREQIVIGCVDNHRARQELARMQGVWVDCGNHFDAGQVVIGNTCKASEVKPFWRDEKEWHHLPNTALLFPELLEPEPEEALVIQDDISCADLVASGEQHLLINEYVALAAGQYIYKLLHRQPITSFMIFVDSDLMSMKPVSISRENLDAYLPAEQEQSA